MARNILDPETAASCSVGLNGFGFNTCRLSQTLDTERGILREMSRTSKSKYQSSLRDCVVGHPINPISIVKEPGAGGSQDVSFPSRPESTAHSPHWLLTVEQDVMSPPSQAMREPRAHPEF